MRDGTNFRDDDYGGSVDNRLRLLREVMERLVAEAGADRVGVRFSPNGETQGCDDSNPESVFVPAAAHLQSLDIAFLELREIGSNGTFGSTDVPKLSPQIRKVFTNPLILKPGLRRRQRPGRSRFGRGRRDRVRPAVYRQSRSGRALPHWREPQHPEREDLLHAGTGRLHRLSGA